MFLRTANALEMVKVFYPVIIRIGCLLQIIVLAIYRKDINKVLVDLQNAVNLSKIPYIPFFKRILLLFLF